MDEIIAIEKIKLDEIYGLIRKGRFNNINEAFNGAIELLLEREVR